MINEMINEIIWKSATKNYLHYSFSGFQEFLIADINIIFIEREISRKVSIVN